MKLLEQIAKMMDDIEIIDTHEHLFPPGTKDPIEDIPNLLKDSCVVYDVISAGMAPDGWVSDGWASRSEKVDPGEGWQRLTPFLTSASNTARYRSLLRSLNELYGVSEQDLQGEGWKEASRAIRDANQRPDWFQHVLQDKAHIRVCLVDNSELCPWGSMEVDERFLLPVLRVDDFIMGSPYLTRNPGNTAVEIAQKMGMGEIRNLDDLISLADQVFDRYAADGGRAVKVAMAYSRGLHFEGVSRAEARYQFDQILRGAFGPDTRKVSDFMMGYCIERATEHDLPIQVHIGMQTGNGMWTDLEGVRPINLTNLFNWYPRARFVILHGGFPFTGEAGVLAKTFPNVYLDLAWIPQLSPTAASNALSEWIEMVPGNKIMWGGDTENVVEELYGAVLGLKDILGSVLSEKVKSGYLNMEGAAYLLRGILADNASRLFRLEG